MATIRIEKALVKGVSSPDTIKRIAEDKSLNPQEVFVRLTFEVDGEEYTASNKLRFLGKKGYEQLVKAKDNNETVDITVDVEKEFFYMNSNTSVDDLFKTELPKRERTSLLNLAKATAQSNSTTTKESKTEEPVKEN